MCLGFESEAAEWGLGYLNKSLHKVLSCINVCIDHFCLFECYLF